MCVATFFATTAFAVNIAARLQAEEEAPFEPPPAGADPEQPPLPPPPPPIPPPAPAPAAEPAPAPIEPAPAQPEVTQPSITPAAPVALGPDAGTQPDAYEYAPPERTLGIQLAAGLSTRFGGETTSVPDDEPVDLSYGGSVWYAPARLWSLGLGFQRLGLGAGETDGADGSFSVQRDVNTLWFGGRAYPWRTDTMGVYVALALGASWQEVSANGARETPLGGLEPTETFSCSASDGPGFALGGGVGLDVDFSRDLAFLAEANAAGHRLTSDTIGGCAPGSGSVTGVGAQLGFMYRFDLDDGPKRRSAPKAVRSQETDVGD